MDPEVEVKLTLTEAEWAEVANALQTKISLVAAGDYGIDVGKDWVRQLRSAYNKLTKRLKAEGILF